MKDGGWMDGWMDCGIEKLYALVRSGRVDMCEMSVA